MIDWDCRDVAWIGRAGRNERAAAASVGRRVRRTGRRRLGGEDDGGD